MVPAGLGEKNSEPQGRALQGTLAGCALALSLPLAACYIYLWLNNCHGSNTETTLTRHDILNLLAATDAYSVQRVNSYLLDKGVSWYMQLFPSL